MPFLLGFLFLAAVYGLLFVVSRLEKKRKPQLKTHRVQAGLSPQQQAKPSRKNVAKVEKSGSKQTGAAFHSAEAKASGHDRKLKTALKDLEQREHRLRELETDIWAQDLGSPIPKQNSDRRQSAQHTQDDWETQHRRVIEDNWQLPSQDPKAAERKELESNQQHQIQDAKTQKLQQEIEADRIRLHQEKQETNRKIEADRMRLLRKQEAYQVPRQLKSKLEKLCGSDYRLAHRLVDGIRLAHPDRPEQWCWEKAIRDMECDRY